MTHFLDVWYNVAMIWGHINNMVYPTGTMAYLIYGLLCHISRGNSKMPTIQNGEIPTRMKIKTSPPIYRAMNFLIVFKNFFVVLLVIFLNRFASGG